MLFLTVLALSVLTFVNYRFGRKALLHPAVVFSAAWAIGLFLLSVSGDMFYPVLPETLAIFLFGAVAFSVGCWIAMLPMAQPSVPHPLPILSTLSNRIISGLLVVIIIGAPFYFHWLSGLVSDGSSSPFLMVVRLSTAELMGGKSTAFTVFATLAELSRIVAMMALWDSESHSKRAVVAIVAALFMTGVTGQKSGPFLLAISLICIDWLKNRRVRWKVVSAMFLIMVATAAVVEFYVHLGAKGSIFENMGSVFRLFVLYGSGGFVGFDQVIRNPHIVPQFNSIDIIFLRIIRKLGANVDIPEVPDYVAIGPDSLLTNAYTMYWSNLNLGYVGMMAATMVTGFIVTLVYKKALQKRHMWMLLYATLLYEVAFSIFTEYFVSMVYYSLRVCVIAWLVYSLPVRWVQFRRFTAKLVDQDVSVPPLGDLR